jgi:hypothetical protein
VDVTVYARPPDHPDPHWNGVAPARRLHAELNARLRADTFCPADLNVCVQLYGPSLDPALEMSDWLDQRWDAVTRSQICGPRPRTHGRPAERYNFKTTCPPLDVSNKTT